MSNMVVYEEYISEVVCEDVCVCLGVLYSSYSNRYGISLCSGDVLVSGLSFQYLDIIIGVL